MKKICAIGSATKDIFMLYEGAETLHLLSQKREISYLLLEQGTKIDIPNLHYATGGGATNAAVTFKRLGLDVEAFFKIGNDIAGSFVHEEMRKENIGISNSIIDPQTATAISFIIPSIEHNHVALCYRGANTKLTKEEFQQSVVISADYIYVSPLSGHSGLLLPFLASLAKEHAIPIATNPSMSQIMHGTDALLTALPSLDIIIVNAYEAAHLMRALKGRVGTNIEKSKKELTQGPQLLEHFITLDDTNLTLFDYFHQIFKHGLNCAVVTNGVEGVYVATREYVYFHPSLKADVVCGLGAGDAFSSAFIGTLALGKSLETAILYGIINSCSVIHFADAKQGILSEAELERRMHILGAEKLEQFSLKRK